MGKKKNKQESINIFGKEKTDYKKTLKIFLNVVFIISIIIGCSDSQKDNEKRILISKTDELIKAIIYNDKEAVGKCIEKNNDINKTYFNKLKPLHFAINYSKCDMIMYLISNGADIEAKAYEKKTPLHLAVDKGRFCIVQVLVNQGANIYAADNDNRTALMVAIRNNEIDIAEFLVSKMKKLDSKDEFKRTSLHYAAKFLKNRTLIKKILEKSVNIDSQDIFGATPLLYATIEENIFFVKLLIANNANIDLALSKNLYDKIWYKEDIFNAGMKPFDIAKCQNNGKLLNLLIVLDRSSIH